MDAATRTVLANLAGSFLALIAFAMLAIAVVIVYMLWRGAAMVRPEARRLVGEVESRAAGAEGIARDTARAVIEPQVALATRWVGLKTTVRTLVGLSDRGGSPPSS